MPIARTLGDMVGVCFGGGCLLWESDWGDGSGCRGIGGALTPPNPPLLPWWGLRVVRGGGGVGGLWGGGGPLLVSCQSFCA